MNFIILAGGKSSRLFPLTRENYPKQFINFFSSYSLLEQTINRAKSIDNKAKIYIITSIDYKDLFYEYNKKYDDLYIIYEPSAKNTLPAIIYTISFIDNDEPIICLPSDHYIGNEINFREAILSGIKNNQENLILLGIKPEKPETGYGYIEFIKKENESYKNGEIFDVKSFHEKPNIDKAKEYIKFGNFLWNSGVFIFRKEFINNKLKELHFNIYQKFEIIKNIIEDEKNIYFDKYLEIKNIEKKFFNEYQFLLLKKINDIYNSIESISFDYGISERIKEIKVVYCDCDWTDLGTFESIFYFCKKKGISSIFNSNIILNYLDKSKVYFKDKDYNFINLSNIENKDFFLDKEILIFGNNKTYILNNLENILIVDTDDILYLSKMGESFHIKDFNFIIRKEEEILNSKDLKNNLNIIKFQNTVKRPWGIFTELYNKEDGFKVKRIEVYPGESISLQHHNKRDEHWIIVKGKGIIQIEENKYKCKKGDHFFIKKGQLHRVINEGSESVIFIEVQLGDYLEEDDIVRIEDKYNR